MPVDIVGTQGIFIACWLRGLERVQWGTAPGACLKQKAMDGDGIGEWQVRAELVNS